MENETEKPVEQQPQPMEEKVEINWKESAIWAVIIVMVVFIAIIGGGIILGLIK